MLYLRHQLIFVSLWVFSFVLLSAPPVQPSESEVPCLFLLSTRELFPTHEPHQVTVIVENCGEEYLVLLPNFIPDAGGTSNEPRTKISFAIRDEEGRLVELVGVWEEAKLKMPDPTDFLILAPGHFYGLNVQLDEGAFAHDFRQAGSVRITVRLRSTARSWLSERKISGRLEAEDIPYDLRHVFEGEVESAGLEMRVRD